MAELITTQEEKDAHSYLDFDDVSLGAFTKSLAIMFSEMQEDANGLHKVMAASCAMMLIGYAIDAGATVLESTVAGFTKKGVNQGDWVVTIRRISNLSETAHD